MKTSPTRSSIARAPIAGTSSPGEYPSVLEDAWSEHLAPRGPDAPTVISTFAGGGGSSLGYSIAGYRELLAVEWDANAAETLRLNFPRVPVYHGDIAALSVAECLERAGIAPGELDVFDGSPPCQGSSTAGKRQMDDPRNSLFREYLRLLHALRPRAFVMENVSGMVKGKMKAIFATILQELRAGGYRVRARVLDARYFRVPQGRLRMIFIGIRDDQGIDPNHPRAVRRPFTLADAISDVRNSPEELRAADSRRFAIGRTWGAMRRGRRHFNLIRSEWGRPAHCVTKMTDSTSARQPMHPDECRVFTLAETKRIGSFPDPYRFAGDLGDGKARIGNSVPPLFMAEIAGHVRKLLE